MTNYLVGGFAEIGFGSRFAIVPEVLFSQMSTTLADGVDGSIFNTNQAKVKLNYLSIPLLANVKLAGPLHLEVGPQYGIVISSDETILKNGENAFKNGDFSMIGGLKIKFSKLHLSGRYVIGLDDIGQLSNDDTWKSQSIQVALGLTIL